MRGAYARGEQVAAKRMTRHQVNVPSGAALFQRVFTRLGCEGRPPRFRVEFYAYSSLVLTIRRREESVYVRFSHHMRRRRIRPGAAGPQGRHFDLEKIFDNLNAAYFEGKLQRPHIGWSHRSWRRQFGCYDPGPNHILLNRRLDRPGVPQYAVAYVL